MSRENVEVVKRAIAAFNRRDVDGIVECVHPDVEWFPAMPVTFGGGAFRGREGIESYVGEVRDTWEEYVVVAEDYRDLGDRVLVLSRVEALGIGSGASVGSPLGLIYDFRNSKISRVLSYLDHGEALQAVGLAE
ncbi:MAG: hypothetical protein JWO21_1830 [Solirubrobacterales bacterium]|nr:hypothetical protein [Solirubrobacterales bacterium]